MPRAGAQCSENRSTRSRRRAPRTAHGPTKDGPPTGGGIQRGWTRQHGLVKTTLLLAIAVAASNLRILLSWARRTRDTRDPLTTMDVASRGFVELDDDGHPLAATGPPGGPTA